MKIVLLSTSFCSQCPAQKQELQKITEIPVEILDVDSEQGVEYVKAFGVRGIPFTAILDNEGNVVASKAGKWSAVDIMNKLENWG